MRRALALAAVAAVLALAARASARPVRIGRYAEIPYGISPEHANPTEGAGPSRAFRSEHRAPTEEPSRVWEARLPIGRGFPPAVDRDGTIFVAGMAGVTALTPEGQVRWSVRLGFTSGTPSLTPDGHVAVGTQGGEVVVVSREGDVRVRARVGGAVRGSPLVLGDGSIVVGGFDRTVSRLDAEGRRIFRVVVDTQVQGTPAWDARGSIVVPVGRELLFLSPEGDVQARALLGASIIAGPSLAQDGAAWVLSSDGALFAVERSGRVRSRSDLALRPAIASPFAVGADGAIRIGGRDAGLLCFGPTGTERWRVDSIGALPGGVSVDADGVAVAVDVDGRLLAVDAEGHVRWRAELGTRTSGPPVLGRDGTILVVTERGTLLAYR